MKASEFWRTCEGQMPDAPHADVVVIDMDGFVHVTKNIFWDPEEARWVIQTRWTDEQIEGET